MSWRPWSPGDPLTGMIPGVPLDRGESVFFARQLEFLRPGIFEELYPDLESRRIVPLEVRVVCDPPVLRPYDVLAARLRGPIWGDSPLKRLLPALRDFELAWEASSWPLYARDDRADALCYGLWGPRAAPRPFSALANRLRPGYSSSTSGAR